MDLPAPSSPYPALDALFREMAACHACPLAEGRMQVVPGAGPEAAELMLLGEGPGAREDREGVPFVGRAGQLLDKVLAAAGFGRDDVFITNVVACRPPRNRAPGAGEIRAHTPWLEEQLRLVDPRLVVALGRTALGYFVPGGKVTELRGRAVTVESAAGRSTRVLPTYHPAAALRRRELFEVLAADLLEARRILDSGKPTV